MRQTLRRTSLGALKQALRVVVSEPENASEFCEELKLISHLQERRQFAIRYWGEELTLSDDLSAAIDELDERWGRPSCEVELEWLLTTGLQQAQLHQATEWRALLDAAAADLAAASG